MQSTPKSLRLHIGLFGRRNVGKSSLLNAITRQQVSIVSEHAGTTTDPVEKPMELLPLGPVQFVDTAGVDDEGALGELRIARTKTVFERVDLGVIVTEAGAWGFFEEGLLKELQSRRVPTLVVLNKQDLNAPTPEERAALEARGVAVVSVTASTGAGILDVREALLNLAPGDFFDSRWLVSDLVPPGETAVLVMPIDKEAPKGRLILPQVMAVRDLLDGGSMSHGLPGPGTQARLDRALEAPRPGRHGLPGLPESGGGCALGNPHDLLQHPHGPLPGRSGGTGARHAGHRKNSRAATGCSSRRPAAITPSARISAG